MQEGGGATGAGGSSKPSTPTGGTGGNGTKEGSSSSGLNAQIQMGRKLTQRLGKASVEGSFNKEEVLKALKEVRCREDSAHISVGETFGISWYWPDKYMAISL